MTPALIRRAIGIASTATLVFAVAMIVRLTHSLHSGEVSFAHLITDYRWKPATSLINTIETILAPGIVLPLAGVAALIWVARAAAGSRAPAVALGLTVGAATVLDLVLKALVGASRPPLSWQTVHEVDHGFPSGHACGAAALVSWMFLWAWPSRDSRRFMIAAVLVGAVVALGRLYQDAHYLTDTVGGIALGVLTATAAWAAVTTRFRRGHTPRSK